MLTRQKPSLCPHLCPSAQSSKVFHFSSLLGVCWAQYVCVLMSLRIHTEKAGHSTGLLPGELASGLGPDSSKSLVFDFISKMITWMSSLSETPLEASVCRTYYQIHLGVFYSRLRATCLSRMKPWPEMPGLLGSKGPLYSGTKTFLCEKAQKNSVKESQRA